MKGQVMLDDQPPGTQPEDNEPVVFRQWQFRFFEGKILTLIELLGLQDKQQEKAAKGQFRKEIWDFYWQEGARPEGLDQALDELYKGHRDRVINA